MSAAVDRASLTPCSAPLAVAEQLAEAARDRDGVAAWPPRADGSLLATFVLCVEDERFLVTVERCEVSS